MVRLRTYSRHYIDKSYLIQTSKHDENQQCNSFMFVVKLIPPPSGIFQKWNNLGRLGQPIYHTFLYISPYLNLVYACCSFKFIFMIYFLRNKPYRKLNVGEIYAQLENRGVERGKGANSVQFHGTYIRW